MSILDALYAEEGRRLADIGVQLHNPAASHEILDPVLTEKKGEGPKSYVRIEIDFPWQDGVATEHGAGVMIAPDVCLTAAHLLSTTAITDLADAAYTEIRLSVGATNRGHSPLLVTSNQAIVHADYEGVNGVFRSDLMMLRTPRVPAANVIDIHAIRHHRVEMGEEVVCYGMGVHEDGPNKGQLRDVIRPVRLKAVKSLAGIIELQPIGDEIGISKADSGGPAYDVDEKQAFVGTISHYFDTVGKYRSSFLIPATKGLEWAGVSNERLLAMLMTGEGMANVA